MVHNVAKCPISSSNCGPLFPCWSLGKFYLGMNVYLQRTFGWIKLRWVMQWGRVSKSSKHWIARVVELKASTTQFPRRAYQERPCKYYYIMHPSRYSAAYSQMRSVLIRSYSLVRGSRTTAGTLATPQFRACQSGPCTQYVCMILTSAWVGADDLSLHIGSGWITCGMHAF